jgi:hypothetical protein
MTIAFFATWRISARFVAVGADAVAVFIKYCTFIITSAANLFGRAPKRVVIGTYTVAIVVEFLAFGTAGTHGGAHLLGVAYGLPFGADAVAVFVKNLALVRTRNASLVGRAPKRVCVGTYAVAIVVEFLLSGTLYFAPTLDQTPVVAFGTFAVAVVVKLLSARALVGTNLLRFAPFVFK